MQPQRLRYCCSLYRRFLAAGQGGAASHPAGTNGDKRRTNGGQTRTRTGSCKQPTTRSCRPGMRYSWPWTWTCLPLPSRQTPPRPQASPGQRPFGLVWVGHLRNLRVFTVCFAFAAGIALDWWEAHPHTRGGHGHLSLGHGSVKHCDTDSLAVQSYAHDGIKTAPQCARRPVHLRCARRRGPVEPGLRRDRRGAARRDARRARTSEWPGP